MNQTPSSKSPESFTDYDESFSSIQVDTTGLTGLYPTPKSFDELRAERFAREKRRDQRLPKLPALKFGVLSTASLGIILLLASNIDYLWEKFQFVGAFISFFGILFMISTIILTAISTKNDLYAYGRPFVLFAVTYLFALLCLLSGIWYRYVTIESAGAFLLVLLGHYVAAAVYSALFFRR